MSVRLTSVAAV